MGGRAIRNQNPWNRNLWTDCGAGKPEACETETREPVSAKRLQTRG